MKRKLEITIIVLALVGILIEIISHMFGDTFGFFRGIGLIRYFTIQSNFIILGYFLLGQCKRFNNQELYQRFLPGVVIYITITFVVFATMLQGTFEITGIRILGNYLVHYIVPILSIVYLFMYGGNWYGPKDILLWIIYPVLYLVFMLIYGTITNDYLYPFFDLNTITIGVFVITILILIVFFVILSFITLKILSISGKTKQ